MHNSLRHSSIPIYRYPRINIGIIYESYLFRASGEKAVITITGFQRISFYGGSYIICTWKRNEEYARNIFEQEIVYRDFSLKYLNIHLLSKKMLKFENFITDFRKF